MAPMQDTTTTGQLAQEAPPRGTVPSAVAPPGIGRPTNHQPQQHPIRKPEIRLLSMALSITSQTQLKLARDYERTRAALVPIAALADKGPAPNAALASARLSLEATSQLLALATTAADALTQLVARLTDQDTLSNA